MYVCMDAPLAGGGCDPGTRVRTADATAGMMRVGQVAKGQGGGRVGGQKGRKGGGGCING